jgi:hypothetical protein
VVESLVAAYSFDSDVGEPNKNPPCSLLLFNDLLCFCSSIALEYEMPLHTVWIQSDPPEVEDPGTALLFSVPTPARVC